LFSKSYLKAGTEFDRVVAAFENLANANVSIISFIIKLYFS